MNRELAERLFDSSVRIAGMWPLQGTTYALPRFFEDAATDCGLPPEIATFVHGYDPEDELDGYEFSEAMGDAFNKGMLGFLIMADCPLYTATSAHSAASSWSCWQSTLLYGATAEEAVGAACEWAEKQFTDACAAYRDSGSDAERGDAVAAPSEGSQSGGEAASPDLQSGPSHE